MEIQYLTCFRLEFKFVIDVIYVDELLLDKTASQVSFGRFS